MNYTHTLPSSLAFEGKGLFGYSFGPLAQKDLEIYYIEVEKGHDTFMISRKITRVYYVLSGSGYFTISDRRHDVGPGMLVEVPPKVEYSYSGKMKMIAVSKPRWSEGNDTHTKWNPDVVEGDLPLGEDSRALVTRLLRKKIFGKSPINAYLGLHRRLWSRLPATLNARGPVRSYGDLVHTLARMQNVRGQAHSTYFLRNRPQLELIQRLAARAAKSGAVTVAVLGCSTGAEAYSIAWAIRSAHPDLKLILHAVDISRSVVEAGKVGAYSITTDIFDRMSESEINQLFNRDGDVVTVKPWLKEGIKWRVGDAAEPEIVDALGSLDIVVANNFLCHMNPGMAERCLRNIAGLVRPHGYLIASGIDLDVRTKVADELGWHPLPELLEEIHEGDPVMTAHWPWHYGGLEPLNKKRRDWRRRYATTFKMNPSDKNADDVGGASVNSENVFVDAQSNSAFSEQ
jgi:mannose-6-phosphate isomerase-like protein (cupin superfamily)/SAM-dependent methyltransferase